MSQETSTGQKPKRLQYNREGDYYYGGTPFKITVTKKREKKKKPYRWVSARTKQLQPSELLAPLSAVGSVVSKGVDQLPGGRYVNEYVFPALSVGNWIVGSGNPYKGAEIRANDERQLGAWLPLDFFGPSILGKGVKTTFNAGVNTAARMGNNTARAFAISKELNRAIEETSPRVTIPRSKNLFRTTVYKGGDITDPYSTFFTTDRYYASKYGAVAPYLFESKEVAKAREPLMGARDPVSMDMFVYNNTKSNPNATAIIGHDEVTGEFTPSRGVEIYSMSPRNIYPIQSSEPLTSYKFFERQPSKISEAERLGKTKGDRNQNYDINSDKVYGNLRFIRNIDGLPNVEGGKVQLGNSSKLLTNFTTDLPFRLHAWYPNISGPTYMVVSPRAFKGKKFFSIKPSDSFLDTREAEVTPNQVRIISGDPRILRDAENKGMRTLTSDRLQNLFKLGSEVNQKEYDLGMNGAVRNFQNADRAADNLQWRDVHIDYPKEGVVTPYRAEVDKLITQNFGRPSIKDYQTLQDITGLDAGVTTEFNPEFLKNAIDPLANKDMFNGVYYSVTSPIEEQLMNSIGLYPGPYYNFSNWLKLSKLKGNKLTYK